MARHLFAGFPEPPNKEAREYRALCTEVIDGDTVRCTVDLGFYAYAHVTIRIRGVNTPELRGGSEEERLRARQSRDFLKELLEGQYVRLRTYKDTKSFDRWIGDIFLPGGPSIAQQIIHFGYGVAADA